MVYKVFGFLLVLIFFHNSSLLAQVGIGTTNPSTATALDISSTTDGINYKGLLPPRVPNSSARATITPNSSTDVGMVLFLESNGCYQIWNGLTWENIHCINTIAFTGVAQNFDLATTWGYTSDVAYFDNGVDGFYGITDASNSIFSNLSTLTNNFLGIRDLDDEGNGTTGLATITFATIDISAAIAGTTVAFEYATYRMDNGDDAFYTIIIDGIPQATQQFINGNANSTNSGTISLPIPPGSVSVSLQLQFEQNGEDDVFGFDNFRIIPN
ncbi:hypothetical protein G5B37_01980 [Rasiella rasia]|uniref:Uncharacterized protein n=1 Tax=Rasiella rasia TaxID=2744027 RepID=A0A6G6GIN0_9FLAO|nr:hypothetical protein [Rasiella rasia]QIE58374.1 hypothetical protein G5B37_01980 [Rasiella rasia]